MHEAWSVAREQRLLLADKLHATAHILCGGAVFPAYACNLDVVGIDNGQRGGMHVFVFLWVQIGTAVELEADLIGCRLRVGPHARLIAQNAVMGHYEVWPISCVDGNHFVGLTRKDRLMNRATPRG